MSRTLIRMRNFAAHKWRASVLLMFTHVKYAKLYPYFKLANANPSPDDEDERGECYSRFFWFSL